MLKNLKKKINKLMKFIKKHILNIRVTNLLKKNLDLKEVRFKGIFDGLDPVGQLGDIETDLATAYETGIKNDIDKILKKVSISLNEDQIANIKTLTGLGGLEALLNISKGVKALDILKKKEKQKEKAEAKAIKEEDEQTARIK